MYRWKSWHDSHQRLVLYAGACLAVGVMFGINSWGIYTEERAFVITHPRLFFWDAGLWVWYWCMETLSEFLPIAVLGSALTLGSTSVGREYASGAMAFVLTRPQSRRRIVWDDWILAVAEICIILSMLAIGMAPFMTLLSKDYVGFTAILLPGAVAVAACLYGLTQFLTILTGSSAKGLSAAIATVLIYTMLPSALDQWWHIRWPQKVVDQSFSVFHWEWPRSLVSLWEVALIWALVAVIFPLLSQWLLERREV